LPGDPPNSEIRKLTALSTSLSCEKGRVRAEGWEGLLRTGQRELEG